jgi:hypothetical protein
MNARLTVLRVRRERLSEKAAVQREELALLLAPWRTPLALADSGAAALRYLRSHTGALALVGVALTALAPRRVLRWTRHGLLVWRSYRWVMRLLRAR